MFDGFSRKSEQLKNKTCEVRSRTPTISSEGPEDGSLYETSAAESLGKSEYPSWVRVLHLASSH